MGRPKLKRPGKLPPPPPPIFAPSANPKMPVYTSMAQAAGDTGIPLDIWKVAKRDGCPAFIVNRIYLSKFLPWWFEQELDEDARENWVRRDKRAKALIGEAKLSRLKGISWDSQAVRRFIHDIVHNVFCAELERQAQEYPATLKGKDELEIQKECLRQKEICKRALGVKLEELERISDEDPE